MTIINLNSLGNFNLKEKPETYRTILKEKYGSNSISTTTRRKMSKLIKYGFLCYKPIKNTSKGYGKELIFYSLEKEYFIVFTKNKVFYCENINTDKNKIEILNSYELNCVNWIKKGNKKLNTNEVVLCL